MKYYYLSTIETIGETYYECDRRLTDFEEGILAGIEAIISLLSKVECNETIDDAIFVIGNQREKLLRRFIDIESINFKEVKGHHIEPWSITIETEA